METLKTGSRGAAVKTLQEALNKAGAYALAVDGIFGAKTQAAVRDYQKKNGLSVDGICGPKTWSRLGFETAETPEAARQITKIILHCSATPEGREVSSDTIDSWHKAEKFSPYIDPLTGKKRYIGYHYLVHLDGTVEICRPESVRGCHVAGQNAGSIGICFIGGLASDGKTPKDTRTPEQKKSIVLLVEGLLDTYTKATVHGHCEFAAKACPCFDVNKESWRR